MFYTDSGALPKDAPRQLLLAGQFTRFLGCVAYLFYDASISSVT